VWRRFAQSLIAFGADLDGWRDNAPMSSPARWSLAADPARRIGRTIEFHASIGSTNDRARQALREPGGEGVAVVADEQLAGRGRRGRTWLSPPGANLMVSVGLLPNVDAALGGQLGAAAALAIRDACASAIPEVPLAVRWPNDVVDATGRKVAGLLVEAALEGGRLASAVIGVGINTNWRRADMPDAIRETATSLCELAGTTVDRVELLSRVLGALDAEVALLERGISPVPRLRTVSWLNGREVEVDLGGRSLTGRVVGLGDDGSLLLEHEGATERLTVGEVVRVADPVAAAVGR